MYVYKVVLGDNQGSTNVLSFNLKARNFDEAYSKAKKQMAEELSELRREDAKENPKDRMPKDYAYTIDEISFVLTIEL